MFLTEPPAAAPVGLLAEWAKRVPRRILLTLPLTGFGCHRDVTRMGMQECGWMIMCICWCMRMSVWVCVCMYYHMLVREHLWTLYILRTNLLFSITCKSSFFKAYSIQETPTFTILVFWDTLTSKKFCSGKARNYQSNSTPHIPHKAYACTLIVFWVWFPEVAYKCCLVDFWCEGLNDSSGDIQHFLLLSIIPMKIPNPAKNHKIILTSIAWYNFILSAIGLTNY